MKKSILLFLLALLITGATMAQKAVHGDCRTHIEASYSNGQYKLLVRNYTPVATSYSIIFPDGHSSKSRVRIPGGQDFYFYYTTCYISGTIVVIANGVFPVNCSTGIVQVSL